MKVAVIGTGYVGLTTAVALAYLDHEVVGVDKDPRKLELLQAGKSPIHEKGLDELLQRNGHLRFTDDTAAAVADAQVVIIAVGTPSRPDGSADVSFVEAAAGEIAQGICGPGPVTVVVKSTVPVGTNQRVANVIRRVLEGRPDAPKVNFASNPEFLREGRALEETFYPDRVVIGAWEDEARVTMRRLYDRILSQSFTPPAPLPRPTTYQLPVLVATDPTSAEMIKYASNAFLALKISYINEIAGLCDRVGADVKEVATGMGLDRRIGPLFLGAGLGWGGSCFPKDTAALLSLAGEYGYTMPIVQAARDVNQRQRQVIVEKLQGALKVLRGRVVGVMGLAFKPGTDDVRDGPALELVRILQGLGAHVRVHDPCAAENARRELADVEVDFCADVYTMAEGADALVLATEWDEYRGLRLSRLVGLMKTPVLVDGRNLFEPEVARAAGLTYVGIGR